MRGHLPQLAYQGQVQVYCLHAGAQYKEGKVKEQLQKKTSTQVQEASFRRMKPNKRRRLREAIFCDNEIMFLTLHVICH